MMKMLPYGANILVTSTSSNISNKIPLGQPDFIVGTKQSSTITYSYENKNGTLVSILTNLRIVNFNTQEKTFTLSNDNIIGTLEEPYINLCCNDVNIPISFIDHDGTGNKWGSAEVGDNIKLKGGGSDSYVEVVKNYLISWSETNSQKIFINKSIVSPAYGEYYAIEAYYKYYNDNNEIVNGNSTIWSYSEIPNSITIPKLNGELSNLICDDETIASLKFINYFALGIQVKILDGYSAYQADTRYYIDGLNRTYDNTAFINTNIDGKYYLESDKVATFYNDLNYQWNSDNFYKIESTNTFISPLTSEIKVDWQFNSSCDSYDECPKDCPSDGGCGEQTVVSVSINNPNPYGGVTGYAYPYEVYVGNGNYSVLSYSGDSYTISGDFNAATDNGYYISVSSCTVSGDYITPNYGSGGHGGCPADCPDDGGCSVLLCFDDWDCMKDRCDDLICTHSCLSFECPSFTYCGVY